MMDEGPTLEAVVGVVLAMGLGVGSVLAVPITRSWARWLFNSVVLAVPVLAVLVLVASVARS